MSISIVCPSCATKLQAPSDKAGRKARCPKCGTKIAVASQGILEPARLVPLPQFIKPAEPPDRPEESAPVQTEDFSPPRRKYAIPSRAGLWIGLAVGAFAVVLTIAGGTLWVTGSLGRLGGQQTMKAVGDDSRRIIMDYFQDNLNDPEGLEILELSKPERYKSGNTAIIVKFRARIPAGGRRLFIWRFWLRKDKVIEHFDLEDVTPTEDDSEGFRLRKEERLQAMQNKEMILKGESEELKARLREDELKAKASLQKAAQELKEKIKAGTDPTKE